jgi:uncharacterized protein YtpQ (UPF0354 family)
MTLFAAPKVSSDFKSKQGQMVDVIVQYHSDPTDAMASKAAARGASEKRRLRLIQARAYRMTAEAAVDLANDPDVAYVSADREKRSGQH